MEMLLRSLQVGFILRSVFAGTYFVVGYQFAAGGFDALSQLFSPSSLGISLSVSVIAGITAYTLHRSIGYPVFEYFLNSHRAATWRHSGPLISRETVAVLRKLWCAGVEEGKADEAIVRHVGIWADYTHLLYVSAECLAIGSIVRALSSPDNFGISTPLIAGVLVFFGSAIFSDWRLHAVREMLGFGDGRPNVIAKP